MTRTQRDPPGRLAIVEENFGADGELVDKLRKIQREGDRLPGPVADVGQQHGSVAPRQPGLRTRHRAHDDPQEREEAIAAGCAAFFRKSDAGESILTAIKAATEGP